MGMHFIVRYVSNTDELADSFARAVPEYEFSVAELQEYLLEWKMRPFDALGGVDQWVEDERVTKRERVARETKRKERIAAEKVKEQVQVSSAVIACIGDAMADGNIYGHFHPRTPPQTSPVPLTILTGAVPRNPTQEGNFEAATRT